MTASKNPTLGIWLMIAAVAAFAAQDGFSRHLAGEYNTLMVVTICNWVLAGLVIVLAICRPEGPRAAVRSDRPGAHLVRSVLLVAEICLIIQGYTLIGLPWIEPVSPPDTAFLAVYCALSILSHWLLLKCCERIEAARVQPYAYLQIVFVTLLGLTVHGEVLELPVAFGAAVIIAAGLYALSLERKA